MLFVCEAEMTSPLKMHLSHSSSVLRLEVRQDVCFFSN